MLALEPLAALLLAALATLLSAALTALARLLRLLARTILSALLLAALARLVLLLVLLVRILVTHHTLHESAPSKNSTLRSNDRSGQGTFSRVAWNIAILPNSALHVGAIELVPYRTTRRPEFARREAAKHPENPLFVAGGEPR